MPNSQAPARRLDLAKLDLPSPPRVLEVLVEPYVTYDGEDALEVTVVLDEATPDEELNWDLVGPIHDKIDDYMRAEDPTLFPYTRYLKPSELPERHAKVE